MHEKGLTPDVVAFSAVISACQRCGELECALGLLHQLLASGLVWDATASNAAISACEKGGHWEQALEILRYMHRDRVDSDIITSNAAVTACCVGSQWSRALDLLSDFVANHVCKEPSLVSLTALTGAVEAEQFQGSQRMLLQR